MTMNTNTDAMNTVANISTAGLTATVTDHIIRELNPAEEGQAPPRKVSSSGDSEGLPAIEKTKRTNDDERQSHAVLIEQLRTQLSAARSDAAKARTEAKRAQSDFARTERLLIRVTKERDDALGRAESLRTRHSADREQLNREIDEVRREAQALKGQLYRVSLENETARNDARLVLRALDEERARTGAAGECGGGGKKGSVGSKIKASLGLGGGGKGKMAVVITPDHERMHGSAGPIRYGGTEVCRPQQHPHLAYSQQCQRQHQHEQRMHASFESIPHKPNQSYLPSHRCSRSVEAMPAWQRAATPPASSGTTHHKAGAAYLAPSRQQVPAPASKTLQQSAGGMPRVAPSSRGHSKRTYISSVREDDVAHCGATFMPSVA